MQFTNKKLRKFRRHATIFEFGAVQKQVNLSQILKTAAKNAPLVTKIGFDTNEKGPSKIWVTKPTPDLRPTTPDPPAPCVK